MKTTTIRVRTDTRDKLNQLARRRGAPAAEVIAELVARAEERTLLDEAAQGWKRLATDADALAAYRAEAEDLAAFDSELPAY